MKKCDLVLPRFELLKRQPKVPGVAHTLAKRVIPNEHGAPIEFRVQRSRNGKQWWISASLHGMRMSNTVGTTKADIGERWRKAVESGAVCLSPDD